MSLYGGFGGWSLACVPLSWSKGSGCCGDCDVKREQENLHLTVKEQSQLLIVLERKSNLIVFEHGKDVNHALKAGTTPGHGLLL